MFTTALVMIARNESRCIERSLRSVAGLVDQLIVLDTGSTDNTVAIAQAAGAQVHAFNWVDDFALARNAALAQSQADWNLVLDADEHLVSGGDALKALRHQPPDFVGRIEVRSAYETKGSQQAQLSSTWLPRVLPSRVRYEGAIHEHPVFDLPRRDLDVCALHDGYLPAQMATKGTRNRRLLEAAVRATPHDPYLWYQLGKDHEVHDRFEAALPAYQTALRGLGKEAKRNPAWRHDLVLRTLYVLKTTGRLDEAVQMAEQEMPHWPDSPDFYFVLGDLLLDFAIAHPAQGEQMVPMIRDAWQRCLAIGENPGLDGAVQGRGSDLARHNLAALEATWPSR